MRPLIIDSFAGGGGASEDTKNLFRWPVEERVQLVCDALIVVRDLSWQFWRHLTGLQAAIAGADAIGASLELFDDTHEGTYVRRRYALGLQTITEYVNQPVWIGRIIVASESRSGLLVDYAPCFFDQAVRLARQPDQTGAPIDFFLPPPPVIACRLPACDFEGNIQRHDAADRLNPGGGDRQYLFHVPHESSPNRGDCAPLRSSYWYGEGNVDCRTAFGGER